MPKKSTAPSSAALKAQIKELQTRLSEVTIHSGQLAGESARRQQNLDVTTERLKEAHNQIVVLQSDRDRLTATIEILARRLASPLAETLLARGGWRAANELSKQATELRPPAPVRLLTDYENTAQELRRR